jgi:hypothetical protein
VEQMADFPARAWYVSRAGFSNEVLAYAENHDVLVSAAKDLTALHKRVVVNSL